MGLKFGSVRFENGSIPNFKPILTLFFELFSDGKGPALQTFSLLSVKICEPPTHPQVLCLTVYKKFHAHEQTQRRPSYEWQYRITYFCFKRHRAQEAEGKIRKMQCKPHSDRSWHSRKRGAVQDCCGLGVVRKTRFASSAAGRPRGLVVASDFGGAV